MHKSWSSWLNKSAEEYAQLKDGRWPLNVTRRKPSDEQLDLSNELLNLPGAQNYIAEDGTDVP